MRPARLSGACDGHWQAIDRCRHSDTLASAVFLAATIQDTDQT